MAGAPGPSFRNPQHRLHGLPIVVFDLETTGLELWNESITQIAAMVDENAADADVFARYVWPLTEPSQRVSQLTHITVDRASQTMKYRGMEVDFMQPKAALVDFIGWLERISDGKQVYLAAHNCWKFDARFLLKAVYENDLLGVFSDHVIGFVDTLPVFRRRYPLGKHSGLSNHKLPELARYFRQGDLPDHNAIDDVKMLLKVLRKVSEEDLRAAGTLSVEEVLAEMFPRLFSL